MAVLHAPAPSKEARMPALDAGGGKIKVKKNADFINHKLWII